MNEAMYRGAAQGIHPDVMAMRRPVLIVFDLDGTLTDSAHLGRILFKRVFALLGFGEISDEMADSFNGPSSDEVCRMMGLEGERKQLYNQLIDEVESDLVRSIGRVFPGVCEMLADLSQEATIAILTNGSPCYCRVCIEEYGFAPYVSLSSGFQSGVSKAERMRMWQQETGAQRVIAVGDRGTDIANARAAGACAIGVTFGLGTREELAGADYLCDSAQQVTARCREIIALL